MSLPSSCWSQRLAEVQSKLTIAEDALREIASPDCGVAMWDDGYLGYDAGAAPRVAEGALKRMREVERTSDVAS